MILKTQTKKLVDILKFTRSHIRFLLVFVKSHILMPDDGPQDRNM